MLGDTRDLWPTTQVLREFAASSVRLVSELCVGRYGPIYQAELLVDPTVHGRACRPVAAKALSATASPDMVVVRSLIDQLIDWLITRRFSFILQ